MRCCAASSCACQGERVQHVVVTTLKAASLTADCNSPHC